MVEYAESILNKYGFDNVRVRSIKNNAKIEVPPNQIMVLKEKIIHIKEEIKNLGFYDCLIDEEGFISGKLNRVLNEFQN
jgi:uncharacterized protein